MPDEQLAKLLSEPSEDLFGIYAYRLGALAVIRIQQLEAPGNGKGITLHPRDLDKLISDLVKLRLTFRNA